MFSNNEESDMKIPLLVLAVAGVVFLSSGEVLAVYSHTDPLRSGQSLSSEDQAKLDLDAWLGEMDEEDVRENWQPPKQQKAADNIGITTGQLYTLTEEQMRQERLKARDKALEGKPSKQPQRAEIERDYSSPEGPDYGSTNIPQKTREGLAAEQQKALGLEEW
jgi:hypothetical protein